MIRGERFNSITHLVGAVVAFVGAVALLVVARDREGWQIAAFAVYGVSLFTLYFCSTMYHALRGPAKKVFHVFDHCSIYILIAGTYTPLTLVSMGGAWGWTLFGIVWTLALLGIAKDSLFHGRFRAVSVVLYVLMGWLVVIAFNPLRKALPTVGITWLIAGGIVYTIGIAFFAMSKRVPYAHGIWHLFAVGGSACHYVVMWRMV
jgi:hemolysin III